jgi:hypothetical protein
MLTYEVTLRGPTELICSKLILKVGRAGETMETVPFVNV